MGLVSSDTVALSPSKWGVNVRSSTLEMIACLVVFAEFTSAVLIT